MAAEVRTKNVRINLSAFTLVQYTEVIQVPEDISDDDLKTLADRRYEEVDGGEYVDATDYWEKGTVECVSAQLEDTASLSLVGEELIKIS